MNRLATSRLEIETTTLPIEVLDFLDVSARYLGKEQFPRSLLYQTSYRDAVYQAIQNEVYEL